MKGVQELPRLRWEGQARSEQGKGRGPGLGVRGGSGLKEWEHRAMGHICLTPPGVPMPVQHTGGARAT